MFFTVGNRGDRDDTQAVTTPVELARWHPDNGSRVWYRYEGQDGRERGDSRQPKEIIRDVASPNGLEVWQLERNSIGRVTRQIDPKGRETEYEYVLPLKFSSYF